MFNGQSLGAVQSLTPTLSRIALVEEGNQSNGAQVRFEGAQEVDLVTASAEGAALMAEFQVPAGNYTSLQFEFSDAWTQVFPLGQAEHAQVPQPLLVVDQVFSVPGGQNASVELTISVEESLRLGMKGFEFRPVVTAFQVDDEDGQDLLAPYPAQYRTGGTWLPLLGERTHGALSENITDPYQIPHPVWGEAERPPWSNGSLADLEPPQGLPYQGCLGGSGLCLSISFMETEEVENDLFGLFGSEGPLYEDGALLVPWDPEADSAENEHHIRISDGHLWIESDSWVEAGVPLLLPMSEDVEWEDHFPAGGALIKVDYEHSGDACTGEICTFRVVDPTETDAETQQQAVAQIRYVKIEITGPASASLTLKDIPVVVPV
jgi:hypothetical protein